MKQKIPIILCIDIEPDERVISRNQCLPWRGFEGCYQFFSELRPQLAAATGSPVHYSWFVRMDPQVAETYGTPDWIVQQHRQWFDEFINHGDEIGLHTHAWRWDEQFEVWIADHANQPWIEHCLHVSFDAFYEAFGRSCLSFRFGDRWMNNPTTALIQKLGVLYDLTLEPGHTTTPALVRDECYTGAIPDYTRVPRLPFRPTTQDFRQSDPSRTEGMRMIPLSSGFHRKRHWVFDHIPVKYLPSSHRRAVTLGLWHKPEILFPILNHLLNIEQSPYLTLVLRSDLPIIPLANNLHRCIEHLLNHPRIQDFVFSTPAETMTHIGLRDQRGFAG